MLDYAISSLDLGLAKRLVATSLIIVLLSACQPPDNTPTTAPTATPTPRPTLTPTPAPTSTPTPEPTPTLTPAQAAIWQAYQGSPHANTYGLSKGPNTYCARCHSPRNWDPAAAIDPPPNCVSCKFEFEDSPRIASGNPLVPENEWQDIGCEMCHRVENGVAAAQTAWLNTATGAYEQVITTTALCEKCHTDTDTLRHRRDLDDSAHAEFVCTDCHDPHSAIANCTDSHCHADALAPASPIAGHDAAHATVTCVACHDAAGLEVGPLEAQNVWITFRTVELLGRSSTEPYQSHQLQRTVDCARCHFPDNPWDLSGAIENVNP